MNALNKKIQNHINQIINKRFCITIEPFEARCDVWYGDFQKNLKELEDTYPGADFNDLRNLKNMTGTIEVSDGGQFFIMLLSDKSGLTHESIHLSWKVLSAAGVKLSPDNHEIQNYLVDHIKREIQKKL
jgi:hypothetical protein